MQIPLLWRGYQLFRWNPKSQLSFPTPSLPRQGRGTTHHQEMLCRVPRDQRELRDCCLFHQVLLHRPVQHQRRQQHPDQLRRGPAGNPGELGLCAQGGTLIRAARRCHHTGSHKVTPQSGKPQPSVSNSGPVLFQDIASDPNVTWLLFFPLLFYTIFSPGKALLIACVW